VYWPSDYRVMQMREGRNGGANTTSSNDGRGEKKNGEDDHGGEAGGDVADAIEVCSE
jgi:hypothetical protein